MSLTLGDNFSYGGSKPLDTRQTFATLADMKAVEDSTMYNGCIAYCVAANKTYQWKSTNSVDSSTGRWRVFNEVDGALSSTSENPVQNKVINGVLETTYKKTGGVETYFGDNDWFPFSKNSPGGTGKVIRGDYFKTVIKNALENYFLKSVPTASASVLGGIKVGNNLSIDANGVLSAEGGSVPIVANQFDKANIYSTTEKIVGCWTDGRPVYQKVVDCGALPSNTSKDVAHGISNLGLVIKGYLIVKHASAGVQISIPFVNPVTASANIGVKVNATNIVITDTKDDYATDFPNSYAILQYTKTTDAANSFIYADENDYSTTEHIVGSWIDGKPLYQKVVDFGAGPNATAKSVAHGINNIATVVKIEIMGVSGSGSSSGGSLVAFALDSVTLNSTGQKTFSFLQADKVTIRSDIDQSAKTFKVILKYTKTTD